MQQLLREIDSREIAEWQAFDAIDPIGPDRGDMRAALVASTIANVHRSEKDKPLTLKDFLLVFEREEVEPQSAERIKQLLTQFTAEWNASRPPE